jgi:hypothetical protein
MRYVVFVNKKNKVLSLYKAGGTDMNKSFNLFTKKTIIYLIATIIFYTPFSFGNTLFSPGDFVKFRVFINDEFEYIEETLVTEVTNQAITTKIKIYFKDDPTSPMVETFKYDLLDFELDIVTYEECRKRGGQKRKIKLKLLSNREVQIQSCSYDESPGVIKVVSNDVPLFFVTKIDNGRSAFRVRHELIEFNFGHE